MASLNCREGSWPIDFLGTHYSVSILTTLIRVTLTRTSSILTEEMKMHRYPLLSINDSVISLSHIRTEIWNTHNSRSEFSFQISNKTWTRMKMMKKGRFFSECTFSNSAAIIEIPLTYVYLFPRIFMHTLVFLPRVACTAANSNAFINFFQYWLREYCSLWADKREVLWWLSLEHNEF